MRFRPPAPPSLRKLGRFPGIRAILLLCVLVPASSIPTRGAAQEPAVSTSLSPVVLPGISSAAPVLPVGFFLPSGQVAQQEGPDVSPGGAFLRSLLVPGWGHAASGAHFRGAFYVAAQSGTAWMLTKSVGRRREAQRFRAVELELAEERLRVAGVLQPDTLRLLAEGDPRVETWDELIEARAQQVEDWAALGIFFILLGATDAFVAAHLMDRPEPLSMNVTPSLGGGWELSLSIRPGGRPSRR